MQAHFSCIVDNKLIFIVDNKEITVAMPRYKKYITDDIKSLVGHKCIIKLHSEYYKFIDNGEYCMGTRYVLIDIIKI